MYNILGLLLVSWFSSFSSLASVVPSAVSSIQAQSSGQTDRLAVSWRHGQGGRSSYEVSDGDGELSHGLV